MRGRLLLRVGAFACLLLVMGTIEVFRLAGAYRNLAAARETFTGLQHRLSSADALVGVSAPDVAQMHIELRSAQDRVHAAAAVVGDDPLLAIGAHLPVVGRQIGAARTLTALAVHLGDGGSDAVDILDTVRQARDAPNTSPLEQVVPALLATQPAVTRAEQQLDAVHRLRKELPAGGLIGPLARAVATLDRELPQIDAAVQGYNDALHVLPVMLGYAAPRTYLVLARDSSELVGSGGYDLAFGLLSVDHGRLSRVFFEDTNRLRKDDWPPADPQNYVAPPPALATYLLRGWPMSLADASWWLDFPTSAQQAIQIYQVNTGDQTPIQGVLGIDSYTLEALLGVIGPLTIPQFGVTVTADDVIRQELVITNQLTPRSDGLDPKEFGVLLGKQTFERLQELPAGRWPALVSAVGAQVRHRDVALYDTDPALEQVIYRLGASGAIPAATGEDFLMAADASIGQSKMNLVVQRALALDVALQDDGSATDRLALRYTSPFQTWAEKDQELAAVFAAPSSYFGDYIRMLAPAGAELTGIRYDGEPLARGEPVTQEAGHQEFAAVMALANDGSANVEVTTHVPRPARMAGSTMEYRLRLIKQPGTKGGPCTITVHPPAGWKVLAATLNGVDTAILGGKVTTDMFEDRALVVRLKRGE